MNASAAEQVIDDLDDTGLVAAIVVGMVIANLPGGLTSRKPNRSSRQSSN